MCFSYPFLDVCDLLIPLASRKGLELIVLLDPTLPLLLIGDPDRLKQILMNLIGNAIKFSTQGNVVVKYWHERIPRSKIHKAKKQEQRKILDQLHGRCKIDTTQYRAKHGFNDTDSDGSAEELARLGDDIILHCSVTDQGIGLSPEEQKMLFVSFQQTDNGTTRKYGGTGLGLSICAQLITHMKGKITVDSEKGKGSTFTFTANIRTMTEYDQEQNPAESSRILECQRVLHLRWEALRPRRVLILSPNRLLREQITKTVPGAEYTEFDDVASVLESGMLGTIDGHGTNGGVKATSNIPTSNLQQFDFILVDHVLDSVILDRIYPSPTVAFILLLAPTTETLRWILPPAQKPAYDSDEEIESNKLDVGGRGRIQQPSDLDFAQRAMGRVNSVSYISALKGGVMGLGAQVANGAATTSLANGGTVTILSDATESVPVKINSPKKKATPSQLFKKRKQSGRGPVTLKRQFVPGSSVTTPETLSGSSFQVCRMIKPVRRLKLLQIMYNSLLHQQGLEEARLEEILEDGDMSPVSGISTYSVSSSLKRPLEEEEEDPLVRVVEEKVSVTAQPKDETTTTTTTTDRNDPPKRARNNDALTLLLTQEELKRCRGINVLVAEDDFVSQKILEK